jgi:hypothetical protein
MSLFFVLIIILILLWPHHWLLASDDREGTQLGMWKIQTDEAFSVIYTHSVQLTPVTETYHINSAGELILDETIFYSYGAGLPATTPYDFEMIDDAFRIYNIHMKMEDLVYRTGAIRANHRLLIRSRDIPFLTFSKPGQAVEFSHLRTSLLDYVIKEVIQ